MSQSELPRRNVQIEEVVSKTVKNNANGEKEEPGIISYPSSCSENLLSEITFPTPQISTDSNYYRYRKNVSIYAGRMRGSNGKRVITLTSTERDNVDIDVTIEGTDQSAANSDLVVKFEERLSTSRERDTEQREMDESDDSTSRSRTTKKSSSQTKKSSNEVTSADDKQTRPKTKNSPPNGIPLLNLNVDDIPSLSKKESTNNLYYSGPCDFEFGINDIVEDSYVGSSIG